MQWQLPHLTNDCSDWPNNTALETGRQGMMQCTIIVYLRRLSLLLKENVSSTV